MVLTVQTLMLLLVVCLCFLNFVVFEASKSLFFVVFFHFMVLLMNDGNCSSMSSARSLDWTTGLTFLPLKIFSVPSN